MRVFYYPGCSLTLSARNYDLSVRAIARVLGVDLLEGPGWVCYGGWPCGVLHREEVLALATHNLALTEAAGLDTFVAPCSGCYSRMAAGARAGRRRKGSATGEGPPSPGPFR
ncbi:MAG TPA: heterodisulfide reductase-related iron-sulfur binding cluster [Nitrospinota bacterium]|jgi:heterodisulfide reductase subunit B|nr:heterodisulfide reductase-related iron-sulfur binding cluster [Nitrospinota bacterium]